MGATPSSVSGRLREMLADGAWHPFYALYAEARLLIPPERAVRVEVKAPNNRYGTRLPLEGQVEAGRRSRITSTLSNLGCEVRGTGIAREYRLPGGVPTWPGSAERNARKRVQRAELRAARDAGLIDAPAGTGARVRVGV